MERATSVRDWPVDPDAETRGSDVGDLVLLIVIGIIVIGILALGLFALRFVLDAIMMRPDALPP